MLKQTKFEDRFSFPEITGQTEITRVNVSIRLNDLIDEYARAYGRSLANAAIRISDEEYELLTCRMKEYILTLINIRVNNVSRAPKPEWLRSKRYFAIPPFISLLVGHIGYVYDETIGVEMVPQSVTTDEFQSKDVFMEIERLIMSIPGSDYATEFPNSSRGDWSTMSLCVINDEVKGVTHKTPGVHAVLAAFLNVTGVENILNPRVTYGSLDYFRTFINVLSEVRR